MEDKPTIILMVENQKIASRRSRKDEEGRDYQCGCGKRYLSYPALYTHIKTKHEGKQPEGTLKTGTNPIAKRSKNKLQEETIRQILALFDQYTPQVVMRMDQTLKGSVPFNSRIKKDVVPKQIYEQYANIAKQQQFKLTQTSSLDLALTLFLINMGELVNDKVYEQFLIFVRLARGCFFEHGDQIHKAIFLKKDTGPFQMKDFNSQFLKYFPMVSDFLLRFYIPETETKDRKEANLSLMEIITYDFCNWLNKRKLTQIKIALGRDIEIDFKPPTQSKIKSGTGKAEVAKQSYEKQIKENEEQSEQMSENDDMEDLQELLDKNPSGSKQNELLQ